MTNTDTFDPTTSEDAFCLGELGADLIPHVWAGMSSAAPERANQDAWQADHGVWAVADGMGGLDEGAQAARFVAQRFVALARMRTAPELVGFVRTLSDELIERFGTNSGTTLVGGVLHGTSLDVVYVGDSRVFRLREGRLELVTRDHTVRELALELGTDPNSLTRRQVQGLTSYVGQAGDSVNVGRRSFSVTPGDRLVFLTDGVHRSVPFAELQEMTQSQPIDELPGLLVDIARRNSSVDDATALVVEVSQS